MYKNYLAVLSAKLASPLFRKLLLKVVNLLPGGEKQELTTVMLQYVFSYKKTIYILTNFKSISIFAVSSKNSFLDIHADKEKWIQEF